MRKLKFIGWFAFFMIISLLMQFFQEKGLYSKEFNGITIKNWICILGIIIFAFAAAWQIFIFIIDKKKSGEIIVKIKDNESKIAGLYVLCFFDAIIIIQAVFSEFSLNERSFSWYTLVSLMAICTIIAAIDSKIQSYITDKGIYCGTFIPWGDIVSYKFDYAILNISFSRKIMLIKYNTEKSFTIPIQQRMEVDKILLHYTAIRRV